MEFFDKFYTGITGNPGTYFMSPDFCFYVDNVSFMTYKTACQ